jgi:hypothetical protein
MRPQQKPADSARLVAAKPTARARVSNGSQLFLDRVDGRSAAARRWRDLYRGFLTQTGGRNEVMVRTLASLCLQRDVIDARLARGELIDSSELVSVAGAISRLATKLGIVTDEPIEDGTADAIRALRAQREEAHA